MTPDQLSQVLSVKAAMHRGETIEQMRLTHAEGAIIAALGGLSAYRAAHGAETQERATGGPGKGAV